MTAHELAKALLEQPDLPVVINGWSSDEGFSFEVTRVCKDSNWSFNGAADNDETPRDKLGWKLGRECVLLDYSPDGLVVSYSTKSRV